jgi:hypothetical protein
MLNVFNYFRRKAQEHQESIENLTFYLLIINLKSIIFK